MDMIHENALPANVRFSLPGRETARNEKLIHRIREVCQREGVLPRSAVRCLGVKVSLGQTSVAGRYRLAIE